jgi:hypothetical protein
MKKLLWILALVSFSMMAGAAFASNPQLLKPNGSEALCKGSHYNITWTYSGVTHVKLTLRQNGEIVGPITLDLPPTQHSFDWEVGKLANGTTVNPGAGFKIRVRTVDNGDYDDSDKPFGIIACFSARVPTDRPQLLKFPRLAITGVDLVPNAEGFGIIFGYKNVGTGPLPKRSEMNVKPDFRVLIDGKEIEKGDLFIPETPAPPGWEIKTHFGGWIKYPAAMDNQWHIGNMITVHINENKAGGMNSDSQTYNLKQIALKYGFDVIIEDLSLDWNTGELTAHYRIMGRAPHPDKTFTLLFDNLTITGGIYWTDKKIKPGSYIQKSKMNIPANMRYVEFAVSAYGPALREDLDQRNNKNNKIFRR